MATSPNPGAVPVVDDERGLLAYRGWRFRFDAQRTSTGLYRPVVLRLCSQPGEPDSATPEPLPDDTEEIAYATPAEALRHGQQQAIRWVHDRSGDGQGQF